MSDMKEDEEMVEHEGDSSSDTTESEDLIDAEMELEDSPHSDDEHQIPAENGDFLQVSEGEKNVEEELANELGLDDKKDVSFSPSHEPTSDGTSSDDLDDSENEEGDDLGQMNETGHEVEAAESGGVLDTKQEEDKGGELKTVVNPAEVNPTVGENGVVKEEPELKQELAAVDYPINPEGSNQWIPSEDQMADGDDTGTEEEQAAFMKELENFHKEKCLEFKPPKFYGEGLNCLKLWRQVTRLGGYDRVTSCKLWRQVGESFKPPKTCTTVSWSFRIFYEKALLEYERHKVRGGELHIPDASLTEPIAETPIGSHQASGSGRARRDAAARAMQGWHSQRLLGNGEVGDPIIKDKNSVSMSKREKQLKSVGLLKRKKPSSMERGVKVARTITKVAKPQTDSMVADIGPAADWVKINVKKTKDCFEVYALVPGLLREEVRVQSDPAGRLVISGDPEQPDNPWGVTPFKKVINLPSRIDPHQTSAVVTLHGQLFVRVPFEQSDL